MPLQVLDLGKQFRPRTNIVYPPFKNGRYMEEYFYEYVQTIKDTIESDYVYIPIYWTNLQTHTGFNAMRSNYNILLQAAIKSLPATTKYFTVVQHDDGPLLPLPQNTLIFGACTGSIPLPLIYEDTTNRLLSSPNPEEKPLLASFIGTLTHRVREKLVAALNNKPGIKIISQPSVSWTNNVTSTAADTFINTTLKSKFCLAPRGYGRSSFRFFEAMLLDRIPVYFWDDVEWLPYKELLDYSKFAISIHEKDIPQTYNILKSISEEKYRSMQEELRRVRHYFTLEGMSEYIVNYIKDRACNVSQ